MWWRVRRWELLEARPEEPRDPLDRINGCMSQALSAVAERLGCSERTLRRYANDGLLRARRMTRHRLELPFAEESYLTSHWELLNGLRMALRTERAVRLAVLFGSTAVGDDGDSSDVV